MNICCADQDQRLRDSTDFETQLYLCNEAFKVPSSTLSKLQQNFKIHSQILTFTDSNLSLKLWSWNISWNFAMKAANARKTEEYHQNIIFCGNKWFWSPQWLDWNTYHRLFSSSALPLYLLFALIVILALLRSTLERWRAPTPPATVGSSSSGCLTKLFSRSRMEFHLK